MDKDRFPKIQKSIQDFLYEEEAIVNDKSLWTLGVYLRRLVITSFDDVVY